MFITENRLDDWVRRDAIRAQGVVVDLVHRLVLVSCPGPKERRFPLTSSIGQPGPDGILETDEGFPPHVPKGRSFWEIGTGIDPATKATKAYRERTKALASAERENATFVFVTPLSGHRGWTIGAQEKWRRTRLAKGKWRDIRVLDATKIVDWLGLWPAVDRWLAGQMAVPEHELDTPEEWWKLIESIGNPPPLPPALFLANRHTACARLEDVISGKLGELKLDTHHPDDVLDFVAAYLTQREAGKRLEALGRCLFISGEGGWRNACALQERHLLVASPKLDLSDTTGVRLLQQAYGRHGVIYGAPPGGMPGPSRERLPNPREHDIWELLSKAGYPDERARILAKRSGGQLSTLQKLVRNVALAPEWLQRTPAADLVIVELLGGWDESSAGDVTVVEKLSGKPYGGWIGAMRDAALQPATPLLQRDGRWKLVARYEGWYALGPRVSKVHLKALQAVALEVLRERDPGLDLPPSERYAADVLGKARPHSRYLRTGIAETLALLGSLPTAIAGVEIGFVEGVAAGTVKAILSEKDWKLWASINDVLPLLAEAAPNVFLDAVERHLDDKSGVFEGLFAQEGDGFTGRNYLTGALWGLEALAWGDAYFARAVRLLARLAAEDPGGKWANRPANSLGTIFLPWFPQTTVSISKRMDAMALLLREFPVVGWKLLLSLLPQSSATTFGSYRPTWRTLIQEDWTPNVTRQEYAEDVTAYALLAVSTARPTPQLLAELISKLNHLPPKAYSELTNHLRSNTLASLPEAERYPIWSALYHLVTMHRKFPDAQWVMTPQRLRELTDILSRLAPATPALLHRRLFSESDNDLLERAGDWEEQREELETRREDAAEEVIRNGMPTAIEFARTVEWPGAFGFALGRRADNAVDAKILPSLLRSEEQALIRLAGGYVKGRFATRQWGWVDDLDTADWDADDLAQLLAYLPFCSEAWDRAAARLGQDQGRYWRAAPVNPFEIDTQRDRAIVHLLDVGRPAAAIRCIYYARYAKEPIDQTLTVRALQSVPDEREQGLLPGAHELLQVIQDLQRNQDTPRAALIAIEWKYLDLFDIESGHRPAAIEEDLRTNPESFLAILRIVYRPKGVDPSSQPGETQTTALHGYKLLNKWRTPPGQHPDGTLDAGALQRWWAVVKEGAISSGHLEVAMIAIGHVLSFAPADPSGLWIHRDVAAILDAQDASPMRRGFETERFNSRGVYTFTQGKAERDLAKSYAAKAEALDKEGFHRFAESLRSLAMTYGNEAERDATHDPFEDM